MGQSGLSQLSGSLLRIAHLLQLVCQPIALFADRAQSLRHRQLPGYLTGSELGLQVLNLRIFARRSPLQLMGNLGLGQGTRALLFPLGQLAPLVQLFVKVAIANLLEDVGVPRFVDVEGFAAVGADDFMHGNWASSCWWDGYLPEHSGPFLEGSTRQPQPCYRCQSHARAGTAVQRVGTVGAALSAKNGAVALVKYAQAAMKSVAPNRVMRCYIQILGRYTLKLMVQPLPRR